MTKNILITILLLFSLFAFGQEKGLTDLFYYPDGEKYKGDAENIYEINLEVEIKGRVYSPATLIDEGDSLTMVGFKLFTNEPLWVLTEDTSKLQRAINAFNYYEYMHSRRVELELKTSIERKNLDKAFILETWGRPDEMIETYDSSGSFEQWFYNELGFILTFENGIVISYSKTE